MYLNGTSQIIRNNGGSIKSFDGDRVMGIFVGGNKRNTAAKTALQINWLVSQCIAPIVKERLKDQTTKWTVTHGVGVGVGEDNCRLALAHAGDKIWRGVQQL